MPGAFLAGFLSSASLLLGALITFRSPVTRRALGLVSAFGVGVLLSAVAYELVGQAYLTSSGEGAVALGLALGTATYFVGDTLLDDSAEVDSTGSGMSIVLGAVLDGVPESFVIGAGLAAATGSSVAVVAAVLISNIPQAMAGSTDLVEAGRSHGFVWMLWIGLSVVCGLVSAAGFAAADVAPPWVDALALAFAGGAVLTMLAQTMLPDAYRDAGRLVGPVVVIGFAVAFALSAAG